MFRYDKDKNNRQIALFNKLWPYVIILWVVVEALSGNLDIAIFIAVVLVCFKTLDVFLRSGFMLKIKHAEKGKKFQWKFEFLILVILAAIICLGYFASDLVAEVI